MFVVFKNRNRSRTTEVICSVLQLWNVPTDSDGDEHERDRERSESHSQSALAVSISGD